VSELAPESALRLDEARSLAARRDWRALAEWGASLGEPALVAEPEAGYLYADACRRLGDPAAALRVIALLEPRVRQAGNHPLLRRVVNLAGMTLFEAGRPAQAEERFAELLELAAEDGDDEFAGRACNNLGMVANLRGRRDAALTYYVRALASYRRVGWTRGLAQTHHNLAISYRDLGFDREADANFRRAIDLAALSDTEDVVAMAETERALLRARSGDGRLAEEMARRAAERCRQMGDPVGVGHAVRVMAAAARADGRDADAEQRLDEALAVARAHSDVLLSAEVQRDRGLLLRDLERTFEAREALLEAVAGFDQIGATAEAEALRAILAELAESG
jgi:tetratricopeptide (TPR) repeat protein